jgi:hypothetical protein
MPAPSWAGHGAVVTVTGGVSVVLTGTVALWIEPALLLRLDTPAFQAWRTADRSNSCCNRVGSPVFPGCGSRRASIPADAFLAAEASAFLAFGGQVSAYSRDCSTKYGDTCTAGRL